MPELPEVETTMRGMAPMLRGETIIRAEARRANLRIEIPTDFADRLTGNVCERLTRRSKYILLHFTDGLVMILHLGMSGKISLYNKASDSLPEPGKHDHLIWETAGGLMMFNDPRRFGLVTFTSEAELPEHKLIRHLGPEPLSNQFHEARLAAALQGKRSPVKTILLDQRTVSGIGNIYACEILWRAAIHPKTLARDIRAEQAADIVTHTRDVLCEAIEAGGSTLKDYAKVDGELGYFQHQFKVYGRAGESCLKPNCGDDIERIVQSGRSSFYCPCCQPAPE